MAPKHAALCLLLGLGLAACQSTQSPAPMAQNGVSDVAFNPAEAAFIKKDGKAVIKGEAFQRDPSGSIIHAAGEIVRLIPQSTYAKERFARFYNGEKFIAARSIPKVEADPAYVELTRTTKVNDRGKFTFEHVPPGDYFVATQVIWQKNTSSVTPSVMLYSNMHPEGGAMFETVTITPKDDEDHPVEVIVSGK